MSGKCEKIGEIVAEYVKLLPSSAEAPAGYPNSKNCNNRKKESAQGTMGRGKWQALRPRFLSFPFPSSPARFLFPSPQPPSDTKRPQQKKEKL